MNIKKIKKRIKSSLGRIPHYIPVWKQRKERQMIKDLHKHAILFTDGNLTRNPAPYFRQIELEKRKEGFCLNLWHRSTTNPETNMKVSFSCQSLGSKKGTFSISAGDGSTSTGKRIFLAQNINSDTCKVFIGRLLSMDSLCKDVHVDEINRIFETVRAERSQISGPQM
jgi:hypothetical protein